VLMQTHVAHCQKPPVKEEDDSQEGKEEAKGCKPQPNFCSSRWQLQQLASAPAAEHVLAG
jgi:hypothetical protein